MNLYSIEVADSMLPVFLRGSHRLGGRLAWLPLHAGQEGGSA